MAAGREALTRLRWRRRGAWLWPSFVAAVVGDGILMHTLPISGDRTQLVGALLLAGVLNLLVVAGLAPLVGIPVRRARPDLPVVVARDYAARALIVALSGLIALLGIGNRGAADAQRRAFEQQALAARRYVLTQAPVAYQRRLGLADTAVLDRNLFRTCVPGGTRGPWLCVFVDTTENPPGVTLDPSRAPNSTFVDSGGG
ncbi:MAG TPA: hypothetical protein VG165_08130 [Solirubrobacteraceae bacterium]|jgi:hypothetical protein|nr:hypothetical protein [Solirubrobacteraceae bacterium]